MRSIWAGAISFGLVVIPVKLYAATEQRDITFRQVHRKDGARIQFRRVCTLDGEEVTAALKTVDGRRVSPRRLRVPQLRGLAEPHGVVLDFGPLDSSRPLVLVMNGWFRYSGSSGCFANP